ncbi:MAG: chorion class high-cysteine HCB protein 13 [Clostridia bacterium]
MGCLNNFCGGNSMWWILILMLVLDDGCNTCDSLIWILLLSRFCNCGDEPANNGCGCGCGCNSAPVGRNCGC